MQKNKKEDKPNSAAERIYKSKVFSIWKPKELPFEYVSVNSATESVMIIAIRKKKIMLTEKYFIATSSLEMVLPGGKIEKNEEAKATAKRELLEETGYIASKLKKLMTMQILPGYFVGKTTGFLATGIQQNQKTPPDTKETTRIIFKTPKEILKMIKSERLTDSRTVATLLYYFTFFQ